MPSNKYRTLDDLRAVIAAQRARGRTVALANGGFDLLHIGHVRYLQAAKALADILVVALNSDASLQRLKGSGRALIDEAGRVTMISALACVDYVTVFGEDRVERVLLALTPDFHCKGSDYTPETVPERDVVKGYGGRIAIVGGDKVRSTSLIVEHIRALYG
jgi:D-glycero-beta-D-manno-heptose 1-phosphate adenylyltransferase